MPLKIEQIFAYVMQEDDGDEGIPAMSAIVSGQPMMMPMIGADEARVRALLPAVREIAAVSGKPFRLLKFTTRTDVTESLPG